MPRPCCKSCVACQITKNCVAFSKSIIKLACTGSNCSVEWSTNKNSVSCSRSKKKKIKSPGPRCQNIAWCVLVVKQ